ncbi:MAG TPA: hypothetical protein VN445_11275 [Rectinemataceae bacterium]|nr:hypothetical protein [Rectinemataceae bacterium]
MNIYKKYWLIAMMIAVATGTLGAQKVLLSGDSPGIVIYDNAGTPTWVTGTITVTKNYSTVTNITVDLSPKADSPYPRNSDWKYIGTSSDSSTYIVNSEIFFSQSTSGNIIKMWGSDYGVESSNVYTYAFPSGSATVGTTTSFQYYAVFWHDSSLAAGTYQLPITFRVRNERFRSGRNPSTQPVDTQTVYVKFVVAPSATISFLSGSSGSTTISSVVFNDVASTTTSNFRVSVKSNFRYSLSVSSPTGHGGELKHTDANVTETIPYTFTIGDSTVEVSSTPYTVTSMERPTGTGTREYAASITVGNIQDYTAGQYSDSISFTVTAQ